MKPAKIGGLAPRTKELDLVGKVAASERELGQLNRKERRKLKSIARSAEYASFKAKAQKHGIRNVW